MKTLLYVYASLVPIIMVSCEDGSVSLKILDSHLMRNANADNFVVVKAQVNNISAKPFHFSTGSFRLETQKGAFLTPDYNETKKFMSNCSESSKQLPPKTSTQCTLAFLTEQLKPELTHLVMETAADENEAGHMVAASFSYINYPTATTFQEIEGMVRMDSEGQPLAKMVTIKSKSLNIPLVHQLLLEINNDTQLASLNARQKKDTINLLKEINFSLFDRLTGMFINMAKSPLKIDTLKNNALTLEDCRIITQSFILKSSEVDTSSNTPLNNLLIDALEKDAETLQALTWSLISKIFQGVLLADKVISIALTECESPIEREELRQAFVNYRQ